MSKEERGKQFCCFAAAKTVIAETEIQSTCVCVYFDIKHALYSVDIIVADAYPAIAKYKVKETSCTIVVLLLSLDESAKVTL